MDIDLILGSFLLGFLFVLTRFFIVMRQFSEDRRVYEKDISEGIFGVLGLFGFVSIILNIILLLIEVSDGIYDEWYLIVSLIYIPIGYIVYEIFVQIGTKRKKKRSKSFSKVIFVS